MLNVPVNNFSVMLGRSHRFLCITSTLEGKYVLPKDSNTKLFFPFRPFETSHISTLANIKYQLSPNLACRNRPRLSKNTAGMRILHTAVRRHVPETARPKLDWDGPFPQPERRSTLSYQTDTHKQGKKKLDPH